MHVAMPPLGENGELKAPLVYKLSPVSSVSRIVCQLASRSPASLDAAATVLSHRHMRRTNTSEYIIVLQHCCASGAIPVAIPVEVDLSDSNARPRKQGCLISVGSNMCRSMIYLNLN